MEERTSVENAQGVYLFADHLSWLVVVSLGGLLGTHLYFKLGLEQISDAEEGLTVLLNDLARLCRK